MEYQYLLLFFQLSVFSLNFQIMWQTVVNFESNSVTIHNNYTTYRSAVSAEPWNFPYLAHVTAETMRDLLPQDSVFSQTPVYSEKHVYQVCPFSQHNLPSGFTFTGIKRDPSNLFPIHRTNTVV